MNSFYNQAKHNKEFLDCVEENFPNSFFDWKITILFYVSIHLIKCLAKTRNVEIGDTHYDIEKIPEETLKLRAQQMSMQDFLKLWKLVKE